MSKKETVGIIGAGSFGTAMANLLALNTNVLVYSRNLELVEQLRKNRFRFGVPLHDRVTFLNDFEEIAARCQLILPIVPSDNFRTMMKSVTPFLEPSHVLLHGTKGFDITGVDLKDIPELGVDRKQVHTMTEVMLQESVVVRTGALTGPNLARELLDGQPSGSVIASKFDEVINRSKEVLSSGQLHVFSTHDVLGAELAGVLKNVIALGSGILKGYGLGKTVQAMMLPRGLHEMIDFRHALGSDHRALFATVGVGAHIAPACICNTPAAAVALRCGLCDGSQDVSSSSPYPPR